MGQTNITIQIDADIKRDAENLFAKLGLNMSSAVNVFFHQAVREQAIPFQIKVKANDEAYDEYFNDYNMKILDESIAELKAGKGVIKTMAELDAMENK